MKTFRLCVTRDISESAIIHIKAETRQEAEIKAYDNQRNYIYRTDAYIGEAYVISCEELIRVKPKPLRYRSALIKAASGDSYYVHTVTEGVADHGDLSKCPSFIRWLGDWQEVEEAAPSNKYPDLSTEGEN